MRRGRGERGEEREKRRRGEERRRRGEERRGEERRGAGRRGEERIRMRRGEERRGEERERRGEERRGACERRGEGIEAEEIYCGALEDDNRCIFINNNKNIGTYYSNSLRSWTFIGLQWGNNKRSSSIEEVNRSRSANKNDRNKFLMASTDHRCTTQCNKRNNNNER